MTLETAQQESQGGARQGRNPNDHDGRSSDGGGFVIPAPASEDWLTSELLAMRTLQEISTRLIQQDDVDALYQDVVDAAVGIMRSDFASLQMLSRERDAAGELRLLAFYGFDPQ